MNVFVRRHKAWWTSYTQGGIQAASTKGWTDKKNFTMRVKGSEVLLQKFLFPVTKVANSCCDILHWFT